MKRPTRTLAVVLTLALAALAAGKDPTRIFGPDDPRLGEPKTLNDYFPMTVPASKEQWEARRKELRDQVLVATGLWPMPEKTSLHPVVHGKIDRDEYTIEKVFFASYPGHYVSGNLYRPKASRERQRPEKVPGVLCPHGHWPNGRFYDAGERAANDQIAQRAEKTMEGARYPLQARCAELARMGCVVFHYDMVGVADSQQIAHRAGFTDAQAELRLQSFMGLQTWNSIRALDFLLSLPEVDPKRIGVTGASGGGTQTFMLCAVDDRPTVAFPAVMVSTAMQGGCVCENCSYLRQEAGNIDLAALFAPKPLGMSGAHDWTSEIETKGLPELKALYRLYGAEDKVMAKCFPQFSHNYNQVSREVMYNWFNKHLHLGLPEPVVEKPFVPVPPQELSVFDDEHPRPKDAVGAEGLRKYLTEQSDRQLAALRPKDADSLEEFRHIVGTALRVMIHDGLPASDAVEAKAVGEDEIAYGSKPAEKCRVQRLLLGRKGQGEEVPAVLVTPAERDGTVVVWLHPAGKIALTTREETFTADVRKVLGKKSAILAIDAFLTGESRPAHPDAVDRGYAGFTFGYNRPLLANRVHDILTAVAYARGLKDVKIVHLVGFQKAGPWVVLARALCGGAVGRTAADLNRFDFYQVTSTSGEMMLPGALKYGGLSAFAALCAPGELYVYNQGEEADQVTWMRQGYQAAGAGERLHQRQEAATPAAVLGWLLR